MAAPRASRAKFWVNGSYASALHQSTNANIRQVAIFLGVVGAVANHEHIADLKADEIERDRDLAPLRLVEQRTRPEIADAVLAQLGSGIGDRPPGIDDVVDEQYRPAGKAGRDIVDQLHHAAAFFGWAVAGEPHKLDLGMGACTVERPTEVGDKHPGTLEHSDHDEIVRERTRDLGGERINPSGDLRCAKQNSQSALCAAEPARPRVSKTRRRR